MSFISETGGEVKLRKYQEPEKMKPFHMFFLVAFFVCLSGVYLWQKFYFPSVDIVVKNKNLNVLVANTEPRMIKGLGGKKDLGKYDGMIFIYGQSGRLGVVMRDMNFPIDIVWFNDGKVVDMAQKVQPTPGVAEKDLFVYYPRVPASIFLELPAGWAEANDLKIGDSIVAIEK